MSPLLFKIEMKTSISFKLVRKKLKKERDNKVNIPYLKRKSKMSYSLFHFENNKSKEFKVLTSNKLVFFFYMASSLCMH